MAHQGGGGVTLHQTVFKDMNKLMHEKMKSIKRKHESFSLIKSECFDQFLQVMSLFFFFFFFFFLLKVHSPTFPNLIFSFI